MAERLRLAADAMPAEKYTFRPTGAEPTFAELVGSLASRTDYLCARITSSPAPARTSLAATADQATLTSRITQAFQYCETALATLADSSLADAIGIDVYRNVNMGPPPRMSRASAMIVSTEYWGGIYSRMSSYLRLNGRVPPEVCRGAAVVSVNLNQLCDSGTTNICKDTRPGQGASTLTLSDAPYSVTSDDSGPYHRAVDNVVMVMASRPAGLVLGAAPQKGARSRSIKVDLNHPVPGGNGVPLGLVVDNHDLELSAQWYTDSDQTSHSVLDIPVGQTVTSQQVEVGLHIGADYYVLQMGEQGYGHCLADGTAFYGKGTTSGTIRRESETKWVVDLPLGSVGRLFDDHLGDPNAVDKGLYYVSLHFVVER
jgi:hypothetical protein